MAGGLPAAWRKRPRNEGCASRPSRLCGVLGFEGVHGGCVQSPRGRCPGGGCIRARDSLGSASSRGDSVRRNSRNSRFAYPCVGGFVKAQLFGEQPS